MQDYLDPLDLEWLVINASKELLSFFKRNAEITYADAIKFARDNAPEIFEESKTGLIRKTTLEKLYEKYKQEALAKSLDTEQEVTARQLIEVRLKELERLTKRYPNPKNDLSGLQNEISQLRRLLDGKQETILNLEKVTEDEALRSDIVAERANKLFVRSHLGKYNVYRDKDNKSIFQIAILHPNKKEKITGADLIYEQYDVNREKVRIAAIQYKIWDKRALYFSQASNVLEQLTKLEACFCENRFCCDSSGDNTSKQFYRLPFCCAFLRPTDKLQNPNSLVTSAYHLPICKINNLKDQGYKDDLIRVDDVRKSALNTSSFEDLFNAEMVGSRWLEINELERFYKKSDLLSDSQNLTIHAQNLSPESVKKLLR